MSRIAALATLTLSALLGACSVLPKSEPLTYYLLPASPTVSQAAAGQVTWSLRVDKPYSNQLLDSPRIAVLPGGAQVAAYQGARWSDRAPILLRDRLVDAIRADGRVAAVSSDDARLAADLVLSSDLRAFQSEYHAGQPAVHIVLEARLVQAGSQQIVASQRFEVRQPTADPSVDAVVAAFGQAGDRLASELVAWTLGEGQRSQ
ncbi:MAG: membrane integrity-associated transporter subunit PqiC [Gammaproteobacteria bacterium]|nr:membrane integrity-associated transporter subunit PqiC [Gammaproteobacteria bacterium]MBU1491965.1 membrane integrity-associated transporter subunit PqiC [Gammaproteobacteria bacterium]MBU2065778.1 membrane integrity-associated transporter subunit PqiC [Gammaproteobacteria bacterium]MBU2140567.1 membrane integrity-associated transporter subunit PqiC [Gammaproteobacteria bacterium]MBU2215860.1 membrane integrity-associated transporter subunit PqiC [Gammaproteobacteria bacterium]